MDFLYLDISEAVRGYETHCVAIRNKRFGEQIFLRETVRNFLRKFLFPHGSFDLTGVLVLIQNFSPDNGL